MNQKPCLECEKFDQETFELLAKIFSQDEISLITMLLAASIKYQATALAKLESRDIRRLQVQRDIDFASVMTGKLLMGLGDTIRSPLIARIRKDHGVALRMKHENCPHVEKPKLQAVPDENSL